MSAGWRPVLTGDGSLTFAHPVHGELCHDARGAFTQARLRYAAGCRLRARGLAAGKGAELHLLDLGTGVGWNLAAALAALAGTGAKGCASAARSAERTARWQRSGKPLLARGSAATSKRSGASSSSDVAARRAPVPCSAASAAARFQPTPVPRSSRCTRERGPRA